MNRELRTILLTGAVLGVVIGSRVVTSFGRQSTASVTEAVSVATTSQEAALAQEYIRALLPSSEEKQVPQRKENVPDIILESRSAFAVTNTGVELFLKNPDEPLAIASITKLLTALTALDRLAPAAPVRVTLEAVRVDGDTAELVVGETLSLHDAMLAMLVPSSNDAAVAIAQATGGLGEFVEAMNTKAREIGMTTARFVNPHGLTPIASDGTRLPPNVASARDVAHLMEEALRQPLLRAMVRQEVAQIVSAEGRIHQFESTDILLSRLPGALGGKTGFTLESQGTLVFAFAPQAAIEKREAQPDDQVVTTVILGSGDRFADTEALARWVTGAYTW